ncbi:diversity-generating retroelement protein Avd [Candidatus Peregrinibacteria bacterium]|nr:diversity-generating retroelement protein Avd [Candidatus Peregrinibacteria bacterium]
MSDDLPILQKMYDLYKVFYQYSVHLPKKDRFGIGQRCENQILDLIEQTIKASKSRREDKQAVLYDISLKLDTLKIFVRLMKEVRAIDLKQYTLLQGHINEIGKMLGGWIKSMN